MQWFGMVGISAKPSAICDVCWDGWRARVEIHLYVMVVNGAIKSIDGLFGWGGGEEKSDISTIGRRVRNFLINFIFHT